MEIVELDMTKYLGRGIKVFLRNGKQLNFKPLAMMNNNKWLGVNDEGLSISIRKQNILFVKSTF